ETAACSSAGGPTTSKPWRPRMLVGRHSSPPHSAPPGPRPRQLAGADRSAATRLPLPLGLPGELALGERPPLVPHVLPPGERELDLRPAVLEVEPGRDE